MTDILDTLLIVFPVVYGLFARCALPLLAVLIVWHCSLALLRPPRPRGGAPCPCLVLEGNAARLPLIYAENSIGRARTADITLDLPGVSRLHAVMSFRHKKGQWFITGIKSGGQVCVNGVPAEGETPVENYDKITLSGVSLMFLANDASGDDMADSESIAQPRRRFIMRPGRVFTMITLFQAIGLPAILMRAAPGRRLVITAALLLYIGFEWLYFALSRRYMSGDPPAVEATAFFLTGLGLMVTSACEPSLLTTQFLAAVSGVLIFAIMIWFLSDVNRVMKLRIPVGVAALILFAANLALGVTRYGAKNWMVIGGLSIQPSEIIKVLFIYAGCASLAKLETTRNLTRFMIFSLSCIAALFLMNDFGTAAIYFVAFVILALMRSGDIRKIVGICASAAVGGAMIVYFKPYIMRRFEAWGRVWDYASTSGYQQTRTLMYAASGGLLGMGPGLGYLKYVAAATTDLVFGILCEEWGLIIALSAVTLLVMVAVSVRACVSSSRSAFHAMAACAAAGMLLFQAGLNVFGSTDILPLTGVTLPFISRGGSSMVACWALFAFIRSARAGGTPSD